ncbi:MAG: hypothetical protein P1U49_09090 [Minwuia sp.]|nr:hypothetical protein [Minwuia sp.]
MIRTLVALALTFPVMTGAALGAEVRFRAGSATFAFDLPAGYCDGLSPGSTKAEGLRRDLDLVHQRGVEVKAMAMPCDQLGGLRSNIRQGQNLRVLAFGILTRDGAAIAADGSGEVFWQAIRNSARYLKAFASPDAILDVVREMLDQRNVPARIAAIELATDRDRIGVAAAGEMDRSGREDPFQAAALAEPIAGVFLVTSVVEFATVSGDTASLAAAHELRAELREVD